MKSIDVKSLLIGALLTSTIFLGVAATPPEVKRAMDATTGKFWGIAKDHELKALAKSRAKDLGYVGIKNPTEKELQKMYALMVESMQGWELFSVYGNGHPVFRKLITLSEARELEEAIKENP